MVEEGEMSTKKNAGGKEEIAALKHSMSLGNILQPRDPTACVLDDFRIKLSNHRGENVSPLRPK